MLGKIKLRAVRRVSRQAVRVLVLGASLLAVLTAVHTGGVFAGFPAELSPLLALTKWRVAGWSLALAAGLLFGVLAIGYRRWFCRWICPLGTCNEVLSRWGKRLGARPVAAWSVGQVFGIAVLVSVAVGTPLLLWLDPLAVYSAGWQGVKGGGVNTTLLFVPLLVAFALSFAAGGLWCRALCPLGGLQEVARDACRTGWQWCTRVCLWELTGGRNADSGGDAVEECGQDSSTNLSSGTSLLELSRRGLLGVAVAGVWSLWPGWSSAEGRSRLRPPGSSRSEGQYLSLCVRCGNCVRVCPAGILHPDLFPARLTGFGAPFVVFTNEICPPQCRRCAEVCPSGAITLGSLRDKFRRPIGVAVVEGEICLLADEQECGICRAHCPTKAIRLQFSEETYSVLPVVNRARCTGCGACQIICPVTPRKAIRVEPC